MEITDKRILSELKRVQQDPPEGIAVSPEESNLRKWTGYVFGPDDTIWEGGSFYFEMFFPDEYPNKPPKILFKPPIFHPNVHVDPPNEGMVSMNIVKTDWSPSIDAWTLLISLRSLLTDPNPTVYANKVAHELYFKDRKEFNRRI